MNNQQQQQQNLLFAQCLLEIKQKEQSYTFKKYNELKDMSKDDLLTYYKTFKPTANQLKKYNQD